MSDIKTVFGKLCTKFTPDAKKLKTIKKFYLDFCNKNHDHIDFIGTGLIGAQRLRWIETQESRRWFEEVLECDEDVIQKAVYELPSINENFNVSSDALNLSAVWMVSQFLNSKLSNSDKLEAAKLLIVCLHLKFIGSIYSRYFQYPTNREIALKTFESMNYKYELKVFKTWGRYLNARALSTVDKKSIHYDTFMKCGPDEKIVYILSDIQTRIRATIKNLTALYYEIKESDDRISSSSNLVEIDGEMNVKDLARSQSQYQRYLGEIVHDRNTFIQSTLMEIITESNSTIQQDMFLDTLLYIVEHSDDKDVKHFLDDTLLFGFKLIQDRGLHPRDLAGILSVMKGVLNASRNKESDVLKIRILGDKIVRKATGKSTTYPVSSERTGVMLYIYLRAVTRDYFKK